MLQDEDELEEGVETSPGRHAGAHYSLGPGKVVWAKVEGHDWWPARVVRCVILANVRLVRHAWEIQPG